MCKRKLFPSAEYSNFLYIWINYVKGLHLSYSARSAQNRSFYMTRCYFPETCTKYTIAKKEANKNRVKSQTCFFKGQWQLSSSCWHCRPRKNDRNTNKDISFTKADKKYKVLSLKLFKEEFNRIVELTSHFRSSRKYIFKHIYAPRPFFDLFLPQSI